MTTSAQTYFEHLRTYVNDSYIKCYSTNGIVILREKFYTETGERPQTRKVQLLLPGSGFVFKLDYDPKKPRRKKSKPQKSKFQKSKLPLFHFLDDTAKPWSKRCDFVIFYVNKQAFHADCIEFKSKGLSTDKIVPQLKAGACWVRSLKRIIEYYTGDQRRIRLRKFVFAENDKPDAYLDHNRQFSADPSIRYYHFDEVDGQSLAELTNASVDEI